MKKIFNFIKIPAILLVAGFQLIAIGVQAQTFHVDTLLFNGSGNKFINIVFLSDGFKATEFGAYKTKVQQITNYLFNSVPFSLYKNYFNVLAVSIPSAESGANHPGIAKDIIDNVQPVLVVNTYLKSRFDYDSIHRLLVPNTDSINSVVLANFPLSKQNIIIVNSPYYGGSGGSIVGSQATTSIDPNAFEIIVHELGHSYAGLADEYYAGDIYAAEKPNMTQQTNPALVKWKKWLNVQGVGIHRYGTTGMDSTWYRPHENCKMRFLGYPFCLVCKEAIIERTHNLFGNVILDSLPLSDTAKYCSRPIKFKIKTVKPNPNTLRVRWYLDGTLVKINIDSFILNATLLDTGTYTLKVEVLDTTTYTRSITHPAAHTYSVQWIIKYKTLDDEACANSIDDDCDGVIDEGCGCDPPNAPGPISGSGAQCTALAAGNATFSIPIISGATSYNWSVPSNMTIISGQGTDSLKVNWPVNSSALGINGRVCVTAANACGSSQSCINADIQIVRPVQPNSISGPGKVCPGDFVTYSVAAVSRANYYNWIVPLGMLITSEPGTNIIEVAVLAGFVGGNVSVSATNACGTGPARSKTINLNLPLKPGPIMGLASGLCNTIGILYSINPVSNSLFNTWTTSSGGNVYPDINDNYAVADWGVINNATISVVANNGCGSSAVRTLTVTGEPGIPGPISGPTNICFQPDYSPVTVHYSTTTVTGADSYNWTGLSGSTISGQGNKEVDITYYYGGNPVTNQVIYVKAINECGIGPLRILSGISTNEVCTVRELKPSNGEIKIYPNPLKKLLNVDFNELQTGQCNINIMDITGRILITSNQITDEGFNHKTINVHALAGGVYFLAITKAEETSTFKLIVE